ncbi:MAG: flagellar biosynthesis anti-sigma factor FlgM [Bryobacteraceae bacterium]|nr:flagellar biosynthesis anti-sigma factor FlgM [Bryobacteraceae bacterium]
MRIDDPSKTSVQSNSLGRAQGTEGLGRSERGGAAGRSGGTDQVKLSDFASKVNEALRDDGPERAARVEELRKAVAAGTYQVDSRELSAHLVEGALKGF